MKQISIFCACVLLSLNSQAQSKGTITFGTNLLTSSVNSFDDKPVYEQSQQSRIGFFAANNFAVGLSLETGINGNQAVPYSFTAFTRWYAGRKTHQVVKFFVEAGAGVADHTLPAGSDAISSGKKSVKPAFYVSPGVNIFVGQAVALELSPEYRYIGGAGSVNRLGASAGIKFFLSGETFKKLFPNKFVRSF